MDKFNSFFESGKPMTFLAAAVMFIMSAINVNAQMISQTNLESYAKHQYGSSWEKAALSELSNYTLDNQGNMVFTKVIDAPNLSKNELYLEMANWFICNYDNSIQFADKEQGVLIARPFIENISRYAGGFNAYNVSICPTVRAQVMDGKVNVTYTLHDYNVVVEEGGGNTATALAVGLTAAAVTGAIISDANDSHRSRTTVVESHHSPYGGYHTTTVYREYRPRHAFEDALLISCIANAATAAPSKDSKTWALWDCFPFAKKDSHKKASSKAFIMSNIYSQVVMSNIEAAINQCSVAYASNK